MSTKTKKEKTVIKSADVGKVDVNSIRISLAKPIKNPKNGQLYGHSYKLKRRINDTNKDIIIETEDDVFGVLTYFGASKKATSEGAKTAKDLQLSISLNNEDEGESSSKKKFRKNFGKIVVAIEDMLLNNKELKIPSKSKNILKSKGICCPLSFFNKKDKEEKGDDYEKDNKEWRQGKTIPKGSVFSGFLKLKAFKDYSRKPSEWRNEDIATRVYVDGEIQKDVLSLFGKFSTGRFKLHLYSIFINSKKEVYLQIKVHSARIKLRETDETEEDTEDDYDNGALSDEDEDEEEISE